MNSEKTKLRRYENDLYVSGTGVIILGAWSMIKSFMEILLSPESYWDIEAEDPAGRIFLIVFIAICILAFLSILMTMHIYVGLNAARAARGMKHRKGYVAGAIIMLVVTLLSFSAYTDNDPNDLDTTIASFFVDLTTLYVFGAVILSSFRIRKLKEKQVQE
ncbi:MAG: hypothetical protein J5910_10750 [Lachnospiraceae bacterium]|nr:hypothetical protein [Lachnospiraceae bacterium]